MFSKYENELYKISILVISKLEAAGDLAKYKSKDLLDLLEINYPENNCGTDNISDPVGRLINHIRITLKKDPLIRYFFALFCNPTTIIGDDFCKIDDSTYTLKNVRIEASSKQEIEKEFTILFDKLIDGIQIKILYYSLDKLRTNYLKKKPDNHLLSLSNEIFFSNWSEFEKFWGKNFKRQYQNIQTYRDDIIEDFKRNFDHNRYRFPRILSIWHFYELSELISHKEFRNDKLSVNKKYKASLRPSISGKLDEQKILNNRRYNLKRFIRVLNENESNAQLNKSLCLYLFNRNTRLIDSLLLTLKTDIYPELPKTIKYQRNGKQYIRRDKRISSKHKRFFVKKEVLDLGKLSYLDCLGFEHHLLTNKRRNDYCYNDLPMYALLLIEKYIRWLLLSYILENIPDNPSNKDQKFISIYNYLKNEDNDLGMIINLNTIVNPHKKVEPYDRDKFRSSYEYMISNHNL